MQRLWHVTAAHETGLADARFRPRQLAEPILPVYVGSLMTAITMCKRMQEEGVFVNPVVSPGVPPGKELIRISLMATHTDAQIDFALDKLAKVGKEVGLL